MAYTRTQLRKFIDRLFGKKNFNGLQKTTNELKKDQKSDFERFKDWLIEQNAINEFAKEITDGITVYFSDDFAAAYDLRIIGFGKPNNTIVVQLNHETEQSDGLNEEFLEISVKTWKQLGWEIWYLDNKLQWLIVDNENDRKRYKNNDLIKSDRINFQFKLQQIV